MDATLEGMQEYEYESRKRYNFLLIPLETMLETCISFGEYQKQIRSRRSLAKVSTLLRQSVYTFQPFILVQCGKLCSMFSKFGRIAPSVKPSVLRYFYHGLPGDATAANDMGEAKVDERVLQFLQVEPDEPSTVMK